MPARLVFIKLSTLAVCLLVIVMSISCKFGKKTNEMEQLYRDEARFLSLPAPTQKNRVEGYVPFILFKQLRTSFSKDLLGNNINFSKNSVVRVIRKLSFNGLPAYAVLHASRFEIALLKQQDFDANSTSVTKEQLESTPLAAALAKYKTRSLQSLDGLTESSGASALRFAVTIDMCQSDSEWDKDLFDALLKLKNDSASAVKVGLAMTGLWMNGHHENWNTLREWKSSGKLDVVWINHSYHHPISRQPDGGYLFLTAPSVNFRDEVLSLEKQLLEQGEIFSPLFRFPGLTHNLSLLNELNSLSLFALDADAWLAKGQSIRDRSVVLIHGNGNEREGVSLFLGELRKRQSALANHLQNIVSPLSTVVH